MSERVAITFDCLPFRRIAQAGLPLDASEEDAALWQRMREAMARHGVEHTFYLHNGDCHFRLTNGEASYLRWSFEATARTDEADERPVDLELTCRLIDTDFPQPLALEVEKFFHEAVRRAVLVDFQLFLSTGDVMREWRRKQSFMGMNI